MSLMMDAPASMARRATSALVVSIEIGTSTVRGDHASTAGTTRRISSSNETGSAPGRLDSPPMSSRSAPSATSRAASAGVGVTEPAAVGEAVGGDVDDPHDPGHAASFAARSSTPRATHRLIGTANLGSQTLFYLPRLFHHIDDLLGERLARPVEGGLEVSPISGTKLTFSAIIGRPLVEFFLAWAGYGSSRPRR